MSHAVRINKTVWEMLQEEAEKRCTRPSRIIDLAIRKELGVEPRYDVGATARDTDPGGPDVQEEVLPSQKGKVLLDSSVEPPSPFTGNLPEIRLWQQKLKQAEEEYDGYRNGVTAEDWELEQRSDYVVDCANRMEEAQSKLRKLVPTVEE